MAAINGKMRSFSTITWKNRELWTVYTNTGLFPEQQLVMERFTSINYFLPLFFSFFPPPLAQCQEKRYCLCSVRNILLLYSNIELGNLWQLAKEKNLLFED